MSDMDEQLAQTLFDLHSAVASAVAILARVEASLSMLAQATNPNERPILEVVRGGRRLSAPARKHRAKLTPSVT